MEKITELFSGTKGKDTYIKEAKKAADIVDKGIEKGDFSDMNEKLGKLSDTNIEREKYVFESPSNLSVIIIIVCSVFLSMIFVCLGCISVGTLIYSKDYYIYAGIGTSVSAVIIIFNILLIVNGIRNMRFCRRYKVYEEILKYKSTEILDDIASYAKLKTEIVINDLKKAVKRKYIPQGHFGKDEIIFMVSDETFAKYQEKQAVYDRYYRKQVEERARMKERSKAMQEIMNSGQRYIDKIHECNDIIKDKKISEKLDRMERVVSMIFHEVDVNPTQADKLGLFLNYYLPTTEKLLEAYIDLDEKEIKGKSLQKAQKEIELSLDTINDSFEKLLDKFYQEKELDIVSDITAMEVIIKQEG